MGVAPKRLCTVVISNGVVPEAFFPTAPGLLPSSRSAWPSILEPLYEHRNALQVVRGVHMESVTGSALGGHGNVFQKFNGGAYNGETHDMRVSHALGVETAHQYLLLGMPGGHSQTSKYQRPDDPAWKSYPVEFEKSPLRAFDSLFGTVSPSQGGSDGSGGGEGSLDLASRRKQSVLDVSRQQIHQMRSQLGALERTKLDEHESSIARIEQQLLQQMGQGGNAEGGVEGGSCGAPDWNGQNYSGDGSNPADYDTLVDLHTDLITLAFQCQLTSMATFTLAADQGEFSIPSVSSTSYHGSVHSGGHNEYQTYKQYSRYFCLKLSQLITKLATTPDCDGSMLLDNTLILLSSNMGDGRGHSSKDLPILICGGSRMGNRVGYFTDLSSANGGAGVSHFNVLDSCTQMLGLNVAGHLEMANGPLSQLQS